LNRQEKQEKAWYIFYVIKPQGGLDHEYLRSNRKDATEGTCCKLATGKSTSLLGPD